MSLRTSYRLFSLLILAILSLCFVAVLSVKEAKYPEQSQRRYEYDTTQNQSKTDETFWEWMTKDAAAFFTAVLAALTFVLAAVSVVQIVYLRRSDETARRAVDASLRQAEIAESALRANERAWLSVELESWGDFAFYRTGNAELFIKMRIRNFGKTPAISVHTSAIMIEDQREARLSAIALADECKSKGDSSSRLLMPEQSYLRPYGIGIDAFIGDTGKAFLPGIIACVTYQVIPDLSMHQTVVCYYLAIADKDDGSMGGLLTIGGRTASANLKVEVTSGGWAD